MRTTSVLFALVISLVPSVARSESMAEPTKSFEVLAEQCRTLTKHGDYPGALQACELAYPLKSEPWLLAYIAQIHTALLHPVEAREALLRYLRSDQLSEENRKTAEAQVRHLETSISTLVVTTRVEGAEVRIDEQVMDPVVLARGVELMVGAHRVTLQAKGATFNRSVFLRAGERTRIELPGSGLVVLHCATPQLRVFIDDQELNAAQASRGISTPAGKHRITLKVGTSTSSEQWLTVHPDERVSLVCAARPPTSAEPRSASNPRGYWVIGAGLALSGAALATAIANGSEYDRWQTANESLRHDLDTDRDLTLDEARRRAQANNQLMEDIETSRKVAIGLGIAGGLVTAGGVALLFADSAASASHASSSWLRKLASGVSLNGGIRSGEIAWRTAW
jgi:hypothetical protein